MRIAFWSAQRKAGTTFNMAAVACTAVMSYPVTAAVIAADYENQDLENQFESPVQVGNRWKQQDMAAEEDNYFLAAGLDFLLRKSGNTELTEQVIKANMRQIAAEKLYCLPSGKRQYDKWWDKEDLFQKMEQVIERLENYFEVVFIDCGCCKNDFTGRMLKQADVCVLNMPQESELIGAYYRSRIRLKGKVFFLVGKYFPESVYSRQNLQKIYRLEEKELGAVPYNVHLQAAGLNGKTEKYVKNQLQNRCGLQFEQELKRSTQLIMQLAGIEVPEKLSYN